MSSGPMEYSQERYLLAKRTVDDCALNRRVIDELRLHLAPDRVERPRIVELGAGVGTMVMRLVDWGVIERADYVLVDQDRSVLERARRELEGWAGAKADDSGLLVVRRGRTDLSLRFEPGDALQFCGRAANRHGFDAVFANAVLDLMDLTPALERVFECVVPRGVFWFSINFDGETILLPENPLDAEVLRLYHQTMEPPARSGSSKTGRRLLEVVPKLGATLVAAGSSDWVVYPQDGAYRAHESYFLHHIVETVRVALDGHAALDAAHFERWIEARHQQIEQGQLSYIAHQLDVLGRAPGN